MPGAVPKRRRTKWETIRAPRVWQSTRQTTFDKARKKYKRNPLAHIKAKRSNRGQFRTRAYNKGSGLVIPKASFQRLVKEIFGSLPGYDLQFQASALIALQTAAEDLLTRVFTAANLATLHANRDTLFKSDMDFVFNFLCIARPLPISEAHKKRGLDKNSFTTYLGRY